MKGAVKNAINCKLISRIKGAPRRSLVAHPSTISFLFFFFLLNSYETQPRRLSKCRKNCCRPLLSRWTVHFLCLLQTSLFISTHCRITAATKRSHKRSRTFLRAMKGSRLAFLLLELKRSYFKLRNKVHSFILFIRF